MSRYIKLKIKRLQDEYAVLQSRLQYAKRSNFAFKDVEIKQLTQDMAEINRALKFLGDEQAMSNEDTKLIMKIKVNDAEKIIYVERFYDRYCSNCGRFVMISFGNEPEEKLCLACYREKYGKDYE